MAYVNYCNRGDNFHMVNITSTYPQNIITVEYFPSYGSGISTPGPTRACALVNSFNYLYFK